MDVGTEVEHIRLGPQADRILPRSLMSINALSERFYGLTLFTFVYKL